jgi:hypothetical protein
MASLKSVIRHNAVLDGEIVCVDGDGRQQFNDLRFRRRNPASSHSNSCGVTARIFDMKRWQIARSNYVECSESSNPIRGFSRTKPARAVGASKADVMRGLGKPSWLSIYGKV